jgi:hypothetical protein
MSNLRMIPKTQITASNARSGKRQAFEVGPAELDICETLFGSALGSFTQEISGEIDTDNVSSWTDAFGRWNGRCTHSATNIENGHARNDGVLVS